MQPDAVTDGVDIALGGGRLAADGGMTQAFEQVAGAVLHLGEGLVDLQTGDQVSVYLVNLLVELQRIVGGVPKTPGAGEIVEITAAQFAWVDVEHDGLTKADQVGGGAGTVRDAGIPPDGENRSFGVGCAQLRSEEHTSE